MTIERLKEITALAKNLRDVERKLIRLRELEKQVKEMKASKVDEIGADIYDLIVTFDIEHFQKFLEVEIFRTENKFNRLTKELEEA